MAIASSADRTPQHRVVLLGASNLTRGISTVIEASQKLWGSPLEVVTAMGHGRSYGLPSNFLGRTLPGIVHCGLWKSLADRPKLPTTALVTDIGNDLMFGAPVTQIADWVEASLDRLQAADAKVVMTLLPLGSAHRLSPSRFRFFAKLFFPNKELHLPDILAKAQTLQGKLENIGRSRKVTLVEQQTEWYGLDPIHIRLRYWRTVWPAILAACADEGSDLAVAMKRNVAVRGSLSRWCYLRTRNAEHWQLFGGAHQRKQPCGRLKDGSSLSFY
jgi:hypothetical protein